MAAITVARRLEQEDRPATPAEQQTLARWSSWGAIPQVFDENNADWASQRAQLRELLDEDAYAAARLTTINAHYTDPAYVSAVWDTLAQLGFEGGRVLEPGSGAGVFIGMAPDSARMVGVELDATTAAIARGLYPQAEIRTESFADTRVPRGSFDAAVGNVPFADVTLYDPAGNPNGHTMHNHFILKSLASVRPGGMVAVLSSSFTLDAVNPAARREMNGMADLVGAVRLPTGAHRRAAGTEALTDLLILRRRAAGEPARDVSWETVSAHLVDGVRTKINSYFDEHPEHILGTVHVGRGMYGNETVQVRPDEGQDTPARLRAALADIVARARERGQVFAAPSPEQEEQRGRDDRESTSLWDGTLVAGDDGLQVARQGRLEPLGAPKTQEAELRALIELRDGARALLEAEAASPEDTPELDAQRAAVRSSYEAYVARFGPVNRFTQRRTGRFETVIDPATGQESQEEIMSRITPRPLVTFRQDPYSALVRALERFDEETQTATPASMLTRRVVAPRPAKQGAETPDEAVALSLDETGGIDLPFIARMLGVDEDEARGMLGTRVYDDPASGALIYAPEYLSGDVRTKLDAAEEAAASDPRFQANVDALREAVPEAIGIEEIEARMGAVWISPEIHQQFLTEILRDRTVRVENPLPGEWTVRGTRWGVRATNEWGTERRPATDIAAALMEQRRLEVKDEVEDAEGRKRMVLNPVETTAAQEKADAMQERFSEWVWEDPQRAAELAEVYNRRFNSIRLRDYSEAGEYLRLPGLAGDITLEPHQRAAVARMIAEPAVGLFHQVGAGKTLEMVVGASELRRMGLISKPGVVVPNHMLEQFTREWLQAYPQARVLAASTDDLTGDKRRLFIARAAANDWDAVILTQSAFKKLGVSPEFQTRYIEDQLVMLRAALEHAEDADSMSVKRIEKAVLAAENELKKATDLPRDPGISFEDMGIDYLLVDEAHMYKNLRTASKIQDAAIAGSQQATDLHMKLELLRSRHGDRVATLATATPLANSVTEAFVMQRYLRPDLLEAAGVTSFDGWAATFGSQVTEMEMGPAGGFRLKTRFAKFQNVPEMLRMWHVFADVKTAEDLNLPVPLIARRGDGRRDVETVVLEPTPQLEAYIDNIAERAERVASRQVDASEDNMLLISTDGRKAALDLRLVDEDSQPTGLVKLDAVASRILAQWEATRDNEYLDETGQTSPVRGGLQLVFSDLGTPNETRWDAYTELKAKLVDGGMAPDQVRFIHEARNDDEKARLFAAARGGHVAVLIGSTAKMGVGTNIQSRLTAMHHVDCPWRPADLEQRDGRGIRRGNQNPEVAIYRYVVERSFDAYSWQTVARKATFINQIMRGRLDAREIEDIGDTALSASEAKAIASGNPLILEKANADATYQKLHRQEIAHHRAQAALAHTRDGSRREIEINEQTLAQLRAADARTTDVSGDKFRMTVAGRSYDNRADAASAIASWARDHEIDWVRGATTGAPVLGTIGGHEVTAVMERVQRPDFRVDVMVNLALAGVPYSGGPVPADEFRNAGVGLVRTLENKTAAIARSITITERKIVELERTIEEAEARLGKPFTHADELRAAFERVQAVTQQLAQATREESAPAVAAATPQDATRASLADRIQERLEQKRTEDRAERDDKDWDRAAPTR